MAEKTPSPVSTSSNMAHLEWIKVKEEIDSVYSETLMQKISKKAEMNPFVPIGCAATVGCLVLGLYNMKTGNKRMSQKLMRMRVGAQGFTVLAIVVGVFVSAAKSSGDA